MLKSNRVLGGALLAFALIAGQVVARAEDEKAVSLIVKPKMGKVTHTKTVIKTSVMGMDIVVSENQKQTIKEVKENGDVVEEITDEGSTINIGGMDRDNPAAPPVTVTRDKFGKVKEYKSDNAAGFMTPEVAKIMAMLSSSILTDKALKTNDTWQTELENPAVKEKKVTVKDTYLGLDKVDGKDYWKIKQTTEAVVDADGSKMSYDITVWINPADGDTLKVEGTVKDVPTQVGPITMTITSKAVKADDKDKPEIKKEAAKP
jgi:hypothetical protein